MYPYVRLDTVPEGTSGTYLVPEFPESLRIPATFPGFRVARESILLLMLEEVPHQRQTEEKLDPLGSVSQTLEIEPTVVANTFIFYG